MPIEITRRDGSVIRITPDCYLVEALPDSDLSEESMHNIQKEFQPTDKATLVLGVTGVKVKPIYPYMPLDAWF